MKRRLSVAISLVGDPLVVYLDEPSTGEHARQLGNEGGMRGRTLQRWCSLSLAALSKLSLTAPPYTHPHRRPGPGLAPAAVGRHQAGAARAGGGAHHSQHGGGGGAVRQVRDGMLVARRLNRSSAASANSVQGRASPRPARLPPHLPSLPCRLGIFVGGRLRCVGNPRDLVSRFGGCLSFSISTPVGQVRRGREGLELSAVLSSELLARCIMRKLSGNRQVLACSPTAAGGGRGGGRARPVALRQACVRPGRHPEVW